MIFEEEDVIKFYELLKHYNKISPNIAIIGSKKKFNNYVKETLKNIDYDVVYKNEIGTKYTILKGDMEYTFIHVRDTIDLKGNYFRKFI